MNKDKHPDMAWPRLALYEDTDPVIGIIQQNADQPIQAILVTLAGQSVFATIHYLADFCLVFGLNVPDYFVHQGEKKPTMAAVDNRRLRKWLERIINTDATATRRLLKEMARKALNGEEAK